MDYNRRRINSKQSARVLSVLLLVALFFTFIVVPDTVYAAAKKAKTKYSISVSNINSETVIKKGSKIKIAYKAIRKKNGKSKNTKVKFKSSNKKVATVSKKGVIKAKKNGTTYITVYCKKKPSKKKKIKIRVGTPVSSIKVSGYTSLRKGHSATFKRTTNSGATNKNVTWWSNNKAVATVNSSGKVTAKGYGEAKIYAIAKDGSGVSGTLTVTVHKWTKADANWIAHRGLHTSYKENTADAFNAAGKAGFWGCECDIWETYHTPVTEETLPEEPIEETPNGDSEETSPEEPLTEPTENPVDESEGDAENSSDEPTGEPINQPAEDTAVKTVIDSIESLNLSDSSHDYTWIIDNSQSIKTIQNNYDTLDAAQKYAVRTALYDGQTEGLRTFFDAVKTIDTFNSFDLAINHDSTFEDEWGNKGAVKGMTAEQIRNELPGVCFFEEYLAICDTYNMIPVVEFKDYDMSDDAINKAVYMIEKHNQLAKACLISFHDPVLQTVKAKVEARLDAGSEAITYFLISEGQEWKLDTAISRKYTGVSVRKDVFTDSLYTKAVNNGLGVGTWTYKSNALDDTRMYEQVKRHKLDFATVDYKAF